MYQVLLLKAQHADEQTQNLRKLSTDKSENDGLGCKFCLHTLGRCLLAGATRFTRTFSQTQYDTHTVLLFLLNFMTSPTFYVKF